MILSILPIYLVSISRDISMDAFHATHRTGEIPAKLGDLSSLERLHVNRNELTGEGKNAGGACMQWRHRR